MNNFVLSLLMVLGVILASIVWSFVYGGYRRNTLSKLLDLYEKHSLERHRRAEIKQTRKRLEEQKKERTGKENE